MNRFDWAQVVSMLKTVEEEDFLGSISLEHENCTVMASVIKNEVGELSLVLADTEKRLKSVASQVQCYR